MNIYKYAEKFRLLIFFVLTFPFTIFVFNAIEQPPVIDEAELIEAANSMNKLDIPRISVGNHKFVEETRIGNFVIYKRK